MLPFPAPAMLQHALPDDAGSRLLLLAFRRLITQGSHDSAVANQFVRRFGMAFRRPLLLVRVLIDEMKSSAFTTIHIAPCCCQRMTIAEATLIEAALRLPDRPDAARLLLADLLANRHPEGALVSLEAVVGAFTDAGHPIGGWR